MNVQLRLYGIRESESCSFCNLAKETIFHLFCSCKYVQVLWNYVQEITKSRDITFENIVFNNVQVNPTRVENSLILIVKQYISRCLNERLSTTSCKKLHFAI